VLDAAALEKRGIHTVTIVWDNFENAARMQARLQSGGRARRRGRGAAPVNRLSWIMTAAAALAIAASSLGTAAEPALADFLEQALRMLGQ
jgi:hypothetical protein